MLEHALPGKGGTIIETWSTRVAPARIEDADSNALQINGYNEQEWAGAPSFASIADDVAKRLAGASVICGHNVGFDVQFIEAAFARLGRKVRMPYHKVDTVTLAYCAWHTDTNEPGPGLSLDKLRRLLGISLNGGHSALKDAQDARRVYYEALGKLTGNSLW